MFHIVFYNAIDAERSSIPYASEEKARNLGAELFEGIPPEECVLEQVAMVDLLKP